MKKNLIKKILIKNDDCCVMAHLGHSLYQQLKLDNTFSGIDIKREIIKDMNNLQIYINDTLWFDEDRRLRTVGGRLPYAADHVNNIKKEFLL